MIDEGLDRELHRLAGVSRLLVATDFDGTVAPIVTHADNARILPEAEAALAALQGMPGTRVALVSGRSLASLRRTGVSTEGRILAGSHGAELTGIGEAPAGLPGLAELDPPLTGEERERLHALREALDDLVAGGPARHGVWLEDKPAGVAVHTRTLTESGSAGMIAAASDVALPFAVTEKHGKRVLEFALRPSDKGETLSRIRRATGTDAVLFLGDDVTDEDGFRALTAGDLGIKIGPGDTRAAHRIADPAAAAAVLARLAHLRRD